MFEGWQDYYLLVGSAGAALTGLLFVVATLSSNRERSQALAGAKLYMTPIVFHLAAVVLLSGAAMAPEMNAPRFAAVSGTVALVGLVWAVRIVIGILRFAPEGPAHWTDTWFYGVGPGLIYVLLGLVAAHLLRGGAGGADAIAALALALLLLCIRNAWDLVTWLAPRS